MGSRYHKARAILSVPGRYLWITAYKLEEARQAHAAQGHYLRQAWVCIALAMLRIGRFA